MSSNDYGFSTVTEPVEIQNNTKTLEEKIEAINRKLEGISSPGSKDDAKRIEKIIVPFLEKLCENPETEYIRWPNREPIIRSLIKQIKEIAK